MDNTTALQFLANSKEFDEKYEEINKLIKVLGSFITHSVHTVHGGKRVSMIRKLTGEFSAYWITINSFERKRWNEVEFRFRKHGDPVIAISQLNLDFVRYLYDNLDIFVEMAEKCCQENGVIEKFRGQMSRFGM